MWSLILEDGESRDYQNKTWYHGTQRLTAVLQSKRLKTRAEGMRAVNAAAMGLGVYLTDDLDEAKAYVAAGTDGGVVGVQFVRPVKLLRLYDTPADSGTFEHIRSLGLNGPDKATRLVEQWGYQGVHWDMRDGFQKVAVYDPNVLSDVVLVARSITPDGTLDQSWE